MPLTAQDIHEKALSLGFSACGILPLAALKGEGTAGIARRIESFPGAAGFYAARLAGMRRPAAGFAGGAVVVCARRFGVYDLPGALAGRVGRTYQAPIAVVPPADGLGAARDFYDFLVAGGLRCERQLGNSTSLDFRFLAERAGLGLVRRNNFLYTRQGSWVRLMAWVVDAELELVETPALPACPEGCTRCADACPTGALCGPYTMDPLRCVAHLTYHSTAAEMLGGEALWPRMGGWLYGCDACQEACPHNAGSWAGGPRLPAMDAVAPLLGDLPRLAALPDEALALRLGPLFGYIAPANAPVWRANALRAMANGWAAGRLPAAVLRKAALGGLEDGAQAVRQVARWTLELTE